jgi:hypothetical protein
MIFGPMTFGPPNRNSSPVDRCGKCAGWSLTASSETGWDIEPQSNNAHNNEESKLVLRKQQRNQRNQ